MRIAQCVSAWRSLTHQASRYASAARVVVVWTTGSYSDGLGCGPDLQLALFYADAKHMELWGRTQACAVKLSPTRAGMLTPAL